MLVQAMYRHFAVNSKTYVLNVEHMLWYMLFSNCMVENNTSIQRPLTEFVTASCCRFWAHGTRSWLNTLVVQTDLLLWWVIYSQAAFEHVSICIAYASFRSWIWNIPNSNRTEKINKINKDSVFFHNNSFWIVITSLLILGFVTWSCYCIFLLICKKMNFFLYLYFPSEKLCFSQAWWFFLCTMYSSCIHADGGNSTPVPCWTIQTNCTRVQKHVFNG